jgi:alpha-ketoglutarate-dependent taurine dioxygenase
MTTGGVRDAADLKTVNLQANFQWHIDSTFLPVPALVNILTAKIVPSSGGATEFASTRAGWAAMPEALKARVGAAACGTTPASRANGSTRSCRNGPCSTNGRRSTGNRSGPTP